MKQRVGRAEARFSICLTSPPPPSSPPSQPSVLLKFRLESRAGCAHAQERPEPRHILRTPSEIRHKSRARRMVMTAAAAMIEGEALKTRARASHGYAFSGGHLFSGPFTRSLNIKGDTFQNIMNDAFKWSITDTRSV